MVHATRIRKGKAAYANHWVQTSSFKQERSAGRALFLKARRSPPAQRYAVAPVDLPDPPGEAAACTASMDEWQAALVCMRSVATGQ